MINKIKNKIDIHAINELIKTSPIELIAISEKRYFDQLNYVADELVKKSEQCSILLVSGPSASTKTTTANKLSEQLHKRGIHSVVISLDNFFVNRADLPLLDDGEPDFESIRTLDLPVLWECLDKLLTKKQADFPLFDFPNGKRSNKTQHITINDDTIVIFEGIHALNPTILRGQDESQFLKLYVSPHSNYFCGDEMVLSTRNVRLIRRLVRDYFHRGNGIDSTMTMWTNVVKSEMVDIIPFKDEADYLIDSTIMYEPSIYEYYLTKIITISDLSDSHREKMNELLESLNRFCEISVDIVPEDTVLREFLE